MVSDMSAESWKDILAYDELKGFKPPHWCAVLVEVTLFLLFGIGAALLRFTDWAPLRYRLDVQMFCLDPIYFQRALPNEYTNIYYSISIALPFVMVLVCEIERSYYSTNPNYKLFTPVQRFFFISLRPIGMFIFGIFVVSIVADYIKVQVTWPRPYFFNKNKNFCANNTFINSGKLTVQEKFGLTSFPCHLSSVSSFAAFLAICYSHSSVSLNAAPLVKPTIAAGLFVITITGSLYRVEIHYNHWADVICGLMIGSIFAYIANLVLLQRHKRHHQVMTEAAVKLLLPRVALPKSAVRNGNSKNIYVDTATIRTIRSQRSQQSRSANHFQEAPY